MKKYDWWELDKKIEEMIKENITVYPYEGEEINRLELKEDIKNLIYEIAPEYKPKVEDES